MEDSVYEPGDDSYLLAEAVKKYAKGRVLDMGTGSGIQAFAAVQNPMVTSVLGVDINPSAIKHCERMAKGIKNIKFRKSDMFSKIKERFDTIIFNPPYLPADSKVKDIALDGGKRGYEVMQKFLENASEYINDDGRILMLFSSISKKDRVDSIIKENLLEAESVGYKELDDGEKLYVYLLYKSALLLELNRKGIREITRFTHGKRGNIYIAELKGLKVAVKVQRADTMAQGSVDHEVQVLRLVNSLNIGPKLLVSGKNWFAYLFVEGKFIEEYSESSPKKQVIKVLLDVLRQCYKLDKLGINKEEMHNPYKHILIARDDIVLIDFERAKFTKKPKNVTQFCQYLISGRFGTILRKKDINIDRKMMMVLTRNYKKQLSLVNFHEIEEMIK